METKEWTNRETGFRSYLKTHPWIKFQVDLRNADAKLWMNLGEAQSKCEHIMGIPLKPKAAEELHTVYLIKGVAGTTAIEGNTLSEEEVRKIHDGELDLPPSKKYLEIEVSNILEACNSIMADVLTGGPKEITPEVIRSYNKMVLGGLDLEDHVVPGELRTCQVGVMNYRAVEAMDCEHLLNELCQWLNKDELWQTNNLPPFATGLIKAVIAHLYIAWIHPFGDGNGRTARLIEYHILISAGVPTPAAHLLSNHYNQTRQEYLRQLDYASKSQGNICQFMGYAIQGFIDGIREQLDIVKSYQLQESWINYIHDQFRGKTGKVVDRRKKLILGLSAINKYEVSVSKLPQMHPSLVLSYYDSEKKSYKTKTLVRDVKALQEMGLLFIAGGKIRACRENILAFLPRGVECFEHNKEIVRKFLRIREENE